jgi:predicted transcriptional regulator
MKPAEVAWCMTEFLGGRSQTKIAQELHLTSAAVSTALMRFYETYGSSGPDFTHIYDYNQRRDCYFSQALIRYINAGGTISQPPIRQRRPIWMNDAGYPWQTYAQARCEHAWLLRAEGLTLHQIGDHLGVTRERARQLISSYGRRVSRAMRRTRFEWVA